MSKFNKVMAVFFSVLLAVVVISVAASASGENIVEIINEIIENHLYFVNDVEVSEEEFNEASSAHGTTTLVDVEHKLYTETVYRINGIDVSEEEYLARLAEITNSASKSAEPKETKTEAGAQQEVEEPTGTTTITMSSAGLESVAKLADYVDFEDTIRDNAVVATSAVITSDKVVAVKYVYSDNYMSFTDNGYFTANFNGIVYRDVNESGFVFKIGKPEVTNYYVANEESYNIVNTEVGQTVFEFVHSDNFGDIDFNKVFDSIVFYIED